VSAVHTCHKRVKIIHRDIKPDNLFLKQNDDLVLGDFGVSQFFEGEDDRVINTRGTPFFYAPEMLKI
jgi:serine/threonine protein kinase